MHFLDFKIIIIIINSPLKEAWLPFSRVICMFRSDRLIDFVRMNDFLTRYSSLAKFQGDTSYKLKSNQLKNALVVVYFYKSGNIVFPGIEAAALIFIFSVSLVLV